MTNTSRSIREPEVPFTPRRGLSAWEWTRLGLLCQNKDPEELLRLRIHPACGSAGASSWALTIIWSVDSGWFEAHPADSRRSSFIYDDTEDRYLAPPIARAIIDRCLYGVDIDPEAVEIARMSLALRYLDRTAGLDGEPHRSLKGIGRNIRQGNSLIGADIEASASIRRRLSGKRCLSIGKSKRLVSGRSWPKAVSMPS